MRRRFGPDLHSEVSNALKFAFGQRWTDSRTGQDVIRTQRVDCYFEEKSRIHSG